MDFNLDDEQREKALKIAQLGKMVGGDERMDQYLMGELMSILLPPEPETDKVDELASAYALTEDPHLQDLLKQEVYKSQGIDPQERAQQEALMAKFGGEFAPGENPENDYYNTLMQQNPQLLEQYYSQKPDEEKFKWGAIPAGMGVGAGVGAGAGLAGGPLAGVTVPVGAGVGSIIGGIGGLIEAISDKNNESPKEKKKRLDRLIDQYQSNIPRD